MNFIKKIIARLVGKSIDGKLSTASKTKLVAIIGAIIATFPQLSAAVTGEPIIIPQWVLELLAAAGLWTLRDSIKS